MEVNDPSSCFKAGHMVFTAQLSGDNQSEHAAAPERAFLHVGQERKTDVVFIARTF